MMMMMRPLVRWMMVKIGQTSKESEASEVVDKARPLCGTYTDTQSKVVLSESLNEEKH